MPISIPTPSQVKNLVSLFRPSEPAMAVSPKWLFLRSSSLDEAFIKQARVTSDVMGDLRSVTVNGEVYAWPRDADLLPLLTILAELKDARHPHHYLHGKTQISPGDVVIDIGACEGAFSAHAAQLGAEVTVVEPSRLMTRVINTLFELRGLEKPEIVNVLLGENTQELYFLDNSSNPASSRIVSTPEPESYPVPVSTLDAMVEALQLKKVDYIKCDAEGADNGILRSGRKTLEKYRPKLAITTYHNTGDYSELFSFLKGIGYDLSGKGLLYCAKEFRVMMLHAW